MDRLWKATDRASSPDARRARWPQPARPAALWSNLSSVLWPVLWSAVLTAIVIGPMASRGWVVLLDWATGPRVVFRTRIFDGSALPAGPVFFGIAAGLHAVAGAAVGWLVPALALFIAGLGGASMAGALTHSPSGPGVPRSAGVGLAARLIAVTAAVWNPFVHERLYAGQVAVLLGYAWLPWLMASSIVALRTFSPTFDERDVSRRTLRRRRAAPAIFWIVASASSVHFALIGALAVAAAVTAALVVERGWEERVRGSRGVVGWSAATVGAAALATIVWVAPIANNAPPKGDNQTTEAFATRPSGSFGLLGGTLVQRGFWRPTPGGPGTEAGWFWSAAVGALGGAALLGAATGLTRRRPTTRRSTTRRSTTRRQAPDRSTATGVLTVLLAGLVGWLLGQGPHGLVGPVVRALSNQPGPLGVMREPGKFLSLVSLAWVGCLAVGAHALFGRVGPTNRAISEPTRPTTGPTARSSGVAAVAAVATVVAALVVAVAPVALSPGLVGGADGRIRAVRYPVGWAAVRDAVDREPGGTLVVLPFIGYTNPGFTNGRIAKNTARAYFGQRAELSDDAQLAGLEPSRRTSAIATALKDHKGAGALAKLGVRFVAVPTGESAAVVPALRPVIKTPDMSLYAVEQTES